MIAKLYVTILAAMAFSSVIPTSAIARDISEARAAAIWDSTICYGRLDNGLTYYIKHNESPKNRAEFYIVQKVGSINEEESQRGLAHFLEHMAFNGTKNFPGKKIINYLQENGVSFGADLNAYTSIDQTVYNISNVPARKALVDSCLLILHDWSGFITLDNDEIDAERKVIHEEWRTTRDASKRIYEQLLPKMFPNGNRYAHRIPIGLMSVVDNFPHQALREYYHKWYRPDLQGIIVVGDINPQEIEARIKSLWSDIPAKRNAAERIYIEVPDNDAPIVAIAKDKEMTQNSIEVDFKYNPLSDVERKSSLGQRDRYIRAMITSMLSKRLGELMLEPRPPFMSSYVDDGSYVFAQTKNAFVAGAYYKENNWSEALTAVVKELKRAYLYGFTNGEYNREIAISESANDNAYKSQSDRKNDYFVNQCISHFIEGMPIFDAKASHDIMSRLLETVTLEQINTKFKSMINNERNLVLVMQGEDKKGRVYPSENEILAAYKKAWDEPVKAYVDTQGGKALMAHEPVPGKIESSKFNKKYGTTIWKLSNGATVYLRHSDKQKDAISFMAVSKGGYSLIDASDYPNYSNMNALSALGGIGNLSPKELRESLAGKQANCQASVGPISESINGGSTVDDVETLMQLVYLRFTTVKQDSMLFNTWKERYRMQLQNRNINPMIALSDTLTLTMYGHNPRIPIPDMKMVDRIDYDKACRLFLERFKDAGDFNFIFVGNFDLDTMRPLVEKYIASLPSVRKSENYNEKAIPEIRQGKHIKRFSVPMGTPKTTIIYNVSARVKYSQPHRLALSILNQVLSMEYVEQIREKEGGTYSVGVNGNISRVPKDALAFMISFDTNKEQSDGLLKKVISILNDVATKGPDLAKFNKAKEYMQKEYANQSGENDYWISAISNKALFNNDDALSYLKTLENIKPEDVKNMARIIAGSSNIIEVIMDGIAK